MREISESRKAAFIARLNKNGPNGCWLWTGHITKGRCNYGSTSLFGKSIRAHRASWLIHKGPITPGLCVLHRCDNQPCVNPNHLYLGTVQENAFDSVARGRHAEARRDRCCRGHLYTPENIYRRSIAQARRCRMCIEMHRERRKLLAGGIG